MTLAELGEEKADIDVDTPNGDYHRAYKASRYKLETLPSAQSEIIRCKDCKHRDVEDGFCEGRGWPMQLVPDDGFCDKWERSEE